jgi:PAS domain S-box-containing protein
MKAKTLIIDDEEGIRLTFKSVLSEEGYDVLIAEDYPSAVEIMSENNLDFIFTDIILGSHTGIDILREVKERGLRYPVIVITGQPDIKTAAESVRLGAFDYLSKPVGRQTLVRVASMAMQHKALVDEKVHLAAEKEALRYNLQAIFRSVNDAIVTVDKEMRVIQANEATERICGLAPNEILSEEFGSVLEQCNKSCQKVLEHTLKMKSSIKEYRVECRHRGQPPQVVVLNCSPLVDVDNGFMGAVLVIRDITKLTELERELIERHQFNNIIGKCGTMQKIYRLLEDLADTDTTVLITGESGTGKELVAKALHYGSIRSSQPLVTVNCSALAEDLLESELFGHVKGAFTGAIKDKRGRFQAAHGGTILLDEIGDISPRIQLKLLRVLQEKEFERVGDSTPVKVDVRVIAATNRDLREKVRLGEFRADLYYRLKVVEVALPPLRDRREDMPLLVNHFYNLFKKRFKKNIDGISDEVPRTFMRYPWPGNIRELKHAVEHAFVLCRGNIVRLDHLPCEIREYSESKGPASEEPSADRPQAILQVLNKTGWNKAKAARVLGMSRRTIYRKIEKYRLMNNEVY